MAKRLTKPKSISSDPWRSKKWNEIVRGRQFRPSDVPALTLLVQWYQIVDQCIEDMGSGGGVQVAYSNDMGDLKALPQIGTMKQASAEIRALNKQLGLVDGRDVEGGADGGDQDGSADVLRLVQGKRAARRNGTEG